MFVYVDIKRLNSQLSILEDELKEIQFIKEKLNLISSTVEVPEKYLKQLEYMRNLENAICRRRELLQNMIQKFRNVNESIKSDLSKGAI